GRHGHLGSGRGAPLRREDRRGRAGADPERSTGDRGLPGPARGLTLLTIKDVHAGYGATPILFGVSLEVRAGEAVALLGGKGRGKATLMKAAGVSLTPAGGTPARDGGELPGGPPPETARLGVGLVPENRRVFPGLSVRENLELGLSAAPERSAALRRR